MSEERIGTFEEFWPFYVREHSKKATRVLHFVGTTASMACLAGAVFLGKRRLLAAMPFVGYGPAWISHFFIENNRPATFKYPLWSLAADLKMWSLMIRGAMDAEVERVMAATDAPGREQVTDDDGAGRVEIADEPQTPPRRDTLN